MTNKTFMTIVVEYDSEADMPAINANQPVLGGRIVGLAWGDALLELHNKADVAKQGAITTFHVCSICPRCDNETYVTREELLHESVSCEHCGYEFGIRLGD